MRTRRLLPLLGVSLFALALGAFALLLHTLRGGGPAPGMPPGGATLVFAEFGATADRIYTAPAGNPAQRTLVATVDHADGWGITPGPSLAGSLVAYTALAPESAPRRDSPADLWLLDVATGRATRLARDADLAVPPLFDAAGTRLAYRSTSADGEQRLVRVTVADGTRRVQYSYRGQFGAYPVGWSASGDLLVAQLSTTGTDLLRVDGQGAAQTVLHASDDIARDWRLSPDGRALAYLAAETQQERVVYRAHVVRLDGGRAATVAAAPGQQFAPVWTPDGAALTVGREAYPAVSASAITLSLDGGRAAALAAPAQGFDVPLGWSPDGRTLAARSFDGQSAYQPGNERVVLISVDGRRQPVTAVGELIFLGWLTRG